MVDVEVSFVGDGNRREEVLAVGEEVERVDYRAVAGVFEGDDAVGCGGGLDGFEDVYRKEGWALESCSNDGVWVDSTLDGDLGLE